MQMLLLHMRTLESVVDGFLVTESTTCFQTATEKPAVLTEALAAGSLPASLAKMTTVKLVTRADGVAAGCKDMNIADWDPSKAPVTTSGRRYSGRCFQSVQRFALLDMLDAKGAHADDLAFVADVDEIASPSVVQLARECAPFPPHATWGEQQGASAFAGYLHLSVRQFKYGMHCDTGESWWNGPRLYLSFDALRPMGTGKHLAMIRSAGWHLTSFGDQAELVRKLTTFGASNKFGNHVDALRTGRLEACRRDCIELLVAPRPRRVAGAKGAGRMLRRLNNGGGGGGGGDAQSSIDDEEPTPCDNESWPATRVKMRSLVYGLNRVSLQGVVPLDRPLTPSVLRWAFGASLPPYLLENPSLFPSVWSEQLRSEVPRWAPLPKPPALGAPPYLLWHCGAPSSAQAEGYPAMMLYLLGSLGASMGAGVFEFVKSDADVGDVYILTDAMMPPPTLRGPLSHRACTFVRHVPWLNIPMDAAGGHYSGKWCMQKLGLLALVPESVQHAVLLDADTYLLPGGARVLRNELRRLTPSQFVAAPRTDARRTLKLRNRSVVLSVPHRSEGINSGLLALHVQGMRAFEASFCPGRSWWECILEAEPRGYNRVGGDQAIWNALLVQRPSVWRQLPCATHLSIDSLRAAVLRIARQAGDASLCRARAAPGVAGILTAEQTRRRLTADTNDGCGADQPVLVDDARFGPVPRHHADDAHGWPAGVAATHGAARLQPLARLVAALLAAPDNSRRRELLSAFPCWCYHYIKSDGTPAFGAPRGTPQETGCHALTYNSPTPSEGSTAVAATMTPLQKVPSAADASPSFDVGADESGCKSKASSSGQQQQPPPPTVAFCFTGHPRTFIHPSAQASIIQAIRSFGARAYTFFVLTDDDGGSSWAHPAIHEPDARVKAAMAALNPKFASYGPLNASVTEYAAQQRKACGMGPEGKTWAIGGRLFMKTFYETHSKLRSCYGHVSRFEADHGMRFDWIVRMRPDVWFFGKSVAHCDLDPAAISFPVGVIGCNYAPCINDHMAFMPRHLAHDYFGVASDMGTCRGVKDLANHWRNYMVWRLMEQRVPLASPSPLIPYTLLRPCSSESPDYYYPECMRWTSRPGVLEKNAGLSYYTNGSALPHLATFRVERERQYQICRAGALSAFPMFRDIDGSEFDRKRVRACVAGKSGAGGRIAGDRARRPRGKK